MRKILLDNIKTGLSITIGPSVNTYADLPIEDILTFLPEQVAVNYFVGILIDKAETGRQEIGRYDPTVKKYSCMIVVLVKNLDEDLGQTELDTIVNRIIKYLSKDQGNLVSAQKVKDGITERVITYGIDKFDYSSIKGMDEGEMGHICGISFNIRTDIII